MARLPAYARRNPAILETFVSQPERAPCYVRAREDATIVGSDHSAPGRWSVAGIAFKRRIAACDHVLLEGCPGSSLLAQTLAVPELKHALSYDHHAEIIAGSRARYLEDADIAGLLEARGVRLELYGALQLLNMLPELIRQAGPERAYEEARWYAQTWREAGQGYARLDPERAVRAALLALSALPERPEPVYDAGRVFAWYKAKVRDEALICPRASELCRTLKGRKAIVVGLSHVRPLEKELRGERYEHVPGFAEVPLWDAFARTLSAQDREALAGVERAVAFG